MNGSIQSLLSLDLDNIPDPGFSIESTKLNLYGEVVKTYSKNLNPPECNLFNKVTVTVIEDFSIKADFESEPISLLLIDTISTLIGQLCQIYGKDISGRELFDDFDRVNFENRTKHHLFTRDWSDVKYNYPCSLDIIQNKFILSIWGLER